MTMSGDIRVHTQKKYARLYGDLRKHVADAHEIFALCVAVGYNQGHKVPLGKQKDERFWSSTITPDEYASFYAIMVQCNGRDFSAFQSDSQVLEVMEEYANGGMEILLDSILKEYVMTDKGGEPSLDPSCSKELPKVLLAHILDQVTE